MPFVSAKCPNCGSSIQMDDQRETGFCQYCGSKVQIKEAIAKVRIDKSKNLANYRELASSALRGQDYKGAKKYAEMALEENAHDSEMWMVKAKAVLETFEWFSNSPRDTQVIECATNALKYAFDPEKTNTEVAIFLYDAAASAWEGMDDWDATDDFYKDHFKINEDQALNYYRHAPIVDGNSELTEARRKLSEKYLRYVKKHMLSDGAYQWAVRRKNIFFELSPLSLSQKEAEWSRYVDNKDFRKAAEIKDFKKRHDMDDDNDPEGCGCMSWIVTIVVAIIVFAMLKACIH